MPRLHVNDLTLFYQQKGEGPDVVLIHAFTSNQAVWLLTGLVDDLAADFKVTTYDLRGHGSSQRPDRGYTSEHMVVDFVALHAALDLGPAFVVGHSFGGVIAMHAAWKHPQAVRGVVLCDTYFPALRHIEPDMGQAKVWTDLRAGLLAVGADVGERVDFTRLFKVIAALSPGDLARIQHGFGAPGARWLAQIGQLAGTTAGEETFEAGEFTEQRLICVGQPVAGLYDEHSPFQATARFLESRLPSCTIDVVPGAAHLAPLQNAPALAALVRKHLTRWAGAASHSHPAC
jgi:pimeloyl-ACP methyl ester carboxylesterase